MKQLKTAIAALLVCLMTVTGSLGYGVGGGGGGCEGGCYNIYTYSGGNFTFQSQAQNTGMLGGLIVLSYATGQIVVNQWNNTGVATSLTNSAGCIRGGSIVPCRNENGVEPNPDGIIVEPVGSTSEFIQSGIIANQAGYLVTSASPTAAVAYFNQMPTGLNKNLAGQMIAVRWAMIDPTNAATWVASLPLNESNFAMVGLSVGTQMFLAHLIQ